VSDAVKTSVLSGRIKGTVSGPVAGICAVSGYAAMCPSGASNCSCLTVPGGTIRGRLAGSGLAAVAITLDSGLATSVISGSTCQPGFGTATLTTTVGFGKNKIIKNETLNLALLVCDPIRGNAPTTLTGGFGIAAAPAPSPGASGWGTVSGVEKGTSMTLDLKGSVTQ